MALLNLLDEQLDELVTKLKEENKETNKIYKDNKQIVSAHFLARTTGIISGIDVALSIFKKYNSKIVTKNLKNNGEFVNRGDVIAVINGPLDDILTCERLSLSYLRYMSGISTLVSKYLLEIPDLETELVYSGYATPCLDECSKQAFCDGGGVISEGISNLILISKNFSDHFDSFDAAIDAARKNYPAAKFNIEVTTIEEALEAMQTDCKVIRVSALKLEIFSQIAEINKGRKILEAFVEIDSKKIRYLARLGYQYVLIPSITDGAKSLSIEMCFYKRLKKLR